MCVCVFSFKGGGWREAFGVFGALQDSLVQSLTASTRGCRVKGVGWAQGYLTNPDRLLGEGPHALAATVGGER